MYVTKALACESHTSSSYSSVSASSALERARLRRPPGLCSELGAGPGWAGSGTAAWADASGAAAGALVRRPRLSPAGRACTAAAASAARASASSASAAS